MCRMPAGFFDLSFGSSTKSCVIFFSFIKRQRFGGQLAGRDDLGIARHHVAAVRWSSSVAVHVTAQDRHR